MTPDASDNSPLLEGPISRIIKFFQKYGWLMVAIGGFGLQFWTRTPPVTPAPRPPLLRLRDPDPLERIAALRTVQKSAGHRENITTFIEAIGDSDPRVAEIARRNLVAMGVEAVPQLAQALVYAGYGFRVRDSERNRSGFRQTLLQIGEPAVPGLIQIWKKQTSVPVRVFFDHDSIPSVCMARHRQFALGSMDSELSALLVTIKSGKEQLFELLSDASAQIRGRAAIALASSSPPDEPTIAALVELLNDQADDARVYAANALGKIGSPAAPALAEALRQNSPELRKNAAFALALMGPAATNAIDALIENLAGLSRPNEEHCQSCGVAALALANIGTQSIPALLAALRANSPVTSRYAAAAFLQAPSLASEAAPRLIEAMEDVKLHVRANACYALAASGTSGHASLDRLNQSLASKEIMLSGAAAFALQKLDPENPRPVEALVKRIKDPSKTVRVAAVQGLGRLETNAVSAAPSLVLALEDPAGEVSLAAADALGKIKPNPALIVTALAARLGDKRSGVANRAALTLGSIGAPAVPALDQVITGPDDGARWWALMSLGRMSGVKETISPLRKGLRDINPSGRQIAAQSLADVGRPEFKAGRKQPSLAQEAVPDLVNMLEDPDPKACAKAIAALRAIGSDPNMVRPKLLAVLERSSGLIRVEAAACLASMGDRSPPVKAALEEGARAADEYIRSLSVRYRE